MENSVQVTRVITNHEGVEVLQVARAQLEVIRGTEKGQLYDLRHQENLIGCAQDCHVILTDKAISRHHLVLKPTEYGFRLEDLDSTNGTRVNGLRIHQATLEGGEIIEIGKTQLQFIIQSEHDEYPLSNRTSFGEMLGRSLAMRRVFALLEVAADSDATLLIEGETGTGKDLAAENVHRLSARRNEPFVVVDCGSLQPSLIPSELFGHAKGSYTGANKERMGAFEAANRGTIFLDEIGEIELSFQPKLLRVLDKLSIRRVGENHYRPVDVRIIAATNRDLEAEVANGRFRKDLFYRLSTLRVRIPPLREHKDDIAQIARSIVQRVMPRHDPQELVDDRVISILSSHSWPGNVRELRNVVERMLVLGRKPVFDRSNSNKVVSTSDHLLQLPFHEARRELNEEFEKVYITHLLDECKGKVKVAAKKAGFTRQTLHRLMSKHKMENS